MPAPFPETGRDPRATPGYWRGRTVYSRDGAHAGLATGSLRACPLEGCRGLRVAVRWPAGNRTYPCTRGMDEQPDGSWRIA